MKKNLFCVAIILLLTESGSSVILQLFRRCLDATDQCPNKYISFWLYTNETLNDPVRLDPEAIDTRLFDKKLPLKILIHGFIGNRTASPNPELLEPLLRVHSNYVISVDYGPLAKFPCYLNAVSNIKVVGKCTARLVDNLIDGGFFTSDDLHLIGFSLGAHTIGYMANHVKHRLKRVTALDPPQLGFTGVDKNSKLDSDDADFIDVMHTDPFFFGTMEPMGHADFYVNFLETMQPGCEFWKNGYYYNCNHFRAPIYYAESLTSPHGFWAKKCHNWMDYMRNSCENNNNQSQKVPSALMGYFVKKSARGSYFVTTNAKAPFAKEDPLGINAVIIL